MARLVILDAGRESEGIMPAIYVVETPINQFSENTKVEQFRIEMIQAFSKVCDTQVNASFEWELHRKE